MRVAVLVLFAVGLGSAKPLFKTHDGTDIDFKTHQDDTDSFYKTFPFDETMKTTHKVAFDPVKGKVVKYIDISGDDDVMVNGYQFGKKEYNPFFRYFTGGKYPFVKTSYDDPLFEKYLMTADKYESYKFFSYVVEKYPVVKNIVGEYFFERYPTPKNIWSNQVIQKYLFNLDVEERYDLYQYVVEKFPMFKIIVQIYFTTYDTTKFDMFDDQANFFEYVMKNIIEEYLTEKYPFTYNSAAYDKFFSTIDQDEQYVLLKYIAEKYPMFYPMVEKYLSTEKYSFNKYFKTTTIGEKDQYYYYTLFKYIVEKYPEVLEFIKKYFDEKNPTATSYPFESVFGGDQYFNKFAKKTTVYSPYSVQKMNVFDKFFKTKGKDFNNNPSFFKYLGGQKYDYDVSQDFFGKKTTLKPVTYVDEGGNVVKKYVPVKYFHNFETIGDFDDEYKIKYDAESGKTYIVKEVPVYSKDLTVKINKKTGKEYVDKVHEKDGNVEVRYDVETGEPSQVVGKVYENLEDVDGEEDSKYVEINAIPDSQKLYKGEDLNDVKYTVKKHFSPTKMAKLVHELEATNY